MKLINMKLINDLTYVTYPEQSLQLDLHLPDESPGPLPVVLFIPGGGWRNCGKDYSYPWLNEAGFALACMNYRVSGDATAPANLHDCLAALAWLREHAGEYGLDADRIGVWGSSAGGHLAALVGSWPQAGGNARTQVRAICDFCGPTDLTRIAIPEIREQFPTLYEVTEQYLGGPVEERADLARQMSPLSYVSKELPPVLIVHCRGDAVVPVEESLIYYDALKEAGADATLRILELDSHGVPIDEVKDEVAAFFKRTLM
jgi:acetyl esterase/lipase